MAPNDTKWRHVQTKNTIKKSVKSKCEFKIAMLRILKRLSLGVTVYNTNFHGLICMNMSYSCISLEKLRVCSVLVNCPGKCTWALDICSIMFSNNFLSMVTITSRSIKLSDLPHVPSLWIADNKIKTTLNMGFQKMKIKCLQSRRDLLRAHIWSCSEDCMYPIVDGNKSELHTLVETRKYGWYNSWKTCFVLDYDTCVWYFLIRFRASSVFILILWKPRTEICEQYCYCCWTVVRHHTILDAIFSQKVVSELFNLKYVGFCHMEYHTFCLQNVRDVKLRNKMDKLTNITLRMLLLPK